MGWVTSWVTDTAERIVGDDGAWLFKGKIATEREAAQTALQAALSGDWYDRRCPPTRPFQQIGRLRDMGIGDDLQAAVMRGALVQRPVRRLAKQCRRPDAASAATVEEFDLRCFADNEPILPWRVPG